MIAVPWSDSGGSQYKTLLVKETRPLKKPDLFALVPGILWAKKVISSLLTISHVSPKYAPRFKQPQGHPRPLTYVCRV